MPRANLDADAVTQAAAAIVDAGGPHALTLTGLAASLGVAPPSLYKHVAGLPDLTLRVATLAIRRLTDALAAGDAGHDARSGLLGLAGAYRRFALDHAGLYALTQNAVDPTSGAQQAEVAKALAVFGRVIAGYGIGKGASVHGIRLVRAGLHGFVDIEGRGGFQMQQPVEESFAMMVDMLDAALEGLATQGHDSRDGRSAVADAERP